MYLMIVNPSLLMRGASPLDRSWEIAYATYTSGTSAMFLHTHPLRTRVTKEPEKQTDRWTYMQVIGCNFKFQTYSVVLMVVYMWSPLWSQRDDQQSEEIPLLECGGPPWWPASTGYTVTHTSQQQTHLANTNVWQRTSNNGDSKI